MECLPVYIKVVLNHSLKVINVAMTRTFWWSFLFIERKEGLCVIHKNHVCFVMEDNYEQSIKFVSQQYDAPVN